MKTPGHSPTEKDRERSSAGLDPPDETAEGDEFTEVPTVPNLQNPVESSAAGAPVPERAQTGSYRLLRPATSDRLETPTPTPVPATAAGAKKRTIIGITRRSERLSLRLRRG